MVYDLGTVKPGDIHCREVGLDQGRFVNIPRRWPVSRSPEDVESLWTIISTLFVVSVVASKKNPIFRISKGIAYFQR